MVLSEENLRKFLDFIVAKPKLSAAMRAIGASERLIWIWLKRSAAGDPKLLVRWPDPDAEPIPLHEALIQARRQNVILFESAMRSEVLEGIPRVVIEGGKIAYREREDIIRNGDAKVDPETLMLLYGQPDIFLRDEQGNRVPIIQMDPAGQMLKVKMLSALLPQTYGEKRSVDLTAKISGGVLVMGASGKPHEIPREAPMRQIEHIPVAEFTEVDPGVPATEPVEPSADPRYQDAPGDSPLVRDIKRRLREGVTTPRPNHPVDIGRPSGEPEREPAGPPKLQPVERRVKMV